MKNVQIKRDELLAKLRENRDKHVADFNTAQQNFFVKRSDAIRELAKADELGTGVTKALAKLNAMPKPTSYVNSYDRAISMLEREQRDILEITDAEFAQYYLDDWQWRGQYAASTAHYNNG